jgi:hypothetical protein
MALGTNTTGMDDFSTEFTFVDAFRNSRPWVSCTNRVQDTTPQPLDLDASGWVHSLPPPDAAGVHCALTRMYWDLSDPTRSPGAFPSGVYTVTFTGTGTLAFAGSVASVDTPTKSGNVTTQTIHVDPTLHAGGIALIITATDTNDYVRDIQVMLPGFASATDRWHPDFLQSVQNYRVIRYQNWILGQNRGSIGATQDTWAHRPTPNDAQWSVRGVPVEVMVELSNKVHADMWVNIPHPADDNYVTQFATIIAQNLDPTLKVYVEHSNEVWNGIYPQHAFAIAQGRALGLCPTLPDAGVAVCYHALRSRQIFDTFQNVFQQNNIPQSRLVRVLASFAGSVNVTSTAINFVDPVSHIDTASHVDAIAIAPYFGVLGQAELQRVQNFTPQQLMDDLENNQTAPGGVPTVMNQVMQHVAIAQQFHIPVVAYEGGQSLGTVGGGSLQGDATLEALFLAVNRDPAFGQLYSRYLQRWSDTTGGVLFNHYTNCLRYGPSAYFGSLEFINQPRAAAPKYDALQRWIEGH